MLFNGSELRYCRWCFDQLIIQLIRVKMDALQKYTDAVHAVSLSPSDPWLSSTALWWWVWTELRRRLYFDGPPFESSLDARQLIRGASIVVMMQHSRYSIEYVHRYTLQCVVSLRPFVPLSVAVNCNPWMGGRLVPGSRVRAEQQEHREVESLDAVQNLYKNASRPPLPIRQHSEQLEITGRVPDYCVETFPKLSAPPSAF